MLVSVTLRYCMLFGNQVLVPCKQLILGER